MLGKRTGNMQMKIQASRQAGRQADMQTYMETDKQIDSAKLTCTDCSRDSQQDLELL